MADNKTSIILTAVDETKGAFASVNHGLDQLSGAASQLNSVFARLAPLIGVASFTEMIKASLDAADAAGKMAQKYGVTVETLSRYSVAARLANVDNDALGSGLGHLNKSIVAANDGMSTQAKAFQMLGISVRDNNGHLKGTDQVMREIANRFATFPDGPIKTAAAMDIFGKSGANLIPMLNDGRAALDHYGKLADQMGLTINNNLAQSAQDVNDNFTKIKLAAEGAGNSLLEILIPNLKKTSQAMADAAKDGKGLQVVLEGIAGATKIPWDFYFNSLNKDLNDMSAAGRIKDLQAQLGGLKLHLPEAQGGGLLARWLYGTPGEINKNIQIIQNQIDVIQKHASQYDAIGKPSGQAANQRSGFTPNINQNPNAGKRGGTKSLYQIEEGLQEQAQDDEIQRQKKYADVIHQLQVDDFNRRLVIQKAGIDQLSQMLLAGELNQIDIMNMSASQRIGTSTKTMQTLIGAAGEHSRAMFNINKVAAIAQAAIALPETIMGAYKAGALIGGPFLGAAYAAIAGAAQLINIDAIKNAEYGGGGSSAATGGGLSSTALPGQVANPNVVAAAPAAIQAAQPKQHVSIFVSGADKNGNVTFAPADIEKLMIKFAQASGNGVAPDLSLIFT